MFKDRVDAGRQLAAKLKEKFPEARDTVILALPRGGVVLGAEVAKALNVPFDIVVTRKIGTPMNQEYAVAAVSEHEIIVNPREEPEAGYLKEETKKERQEIARRLKEYRGNKPRVELKNQTVILIDDGLATGLTMEVAIKEVRRAFPKKIMLAVPVAPPETIKNLKSQVDEIIVLKIEPMFFAVGQFYKDFPQVSDQEVINFLRDF